MDYEPFLRMCNEELPPSTTKSCDAFIQRVEDVFGGQTTTLHNPVCIRSLFFVSKRGIGKSQFYKIKSLVKVFYKYLYLQHLVGEETLAYVDSLTLESIVTDEELELLYFKDLDACLGFVARVGKFYGFTSSDLLFNKAIVILAWHGVSISEMVNMLKSDIQTDSVHIRGRETDVVIGVDHLKILKNFANTDKQEGFPNHKMQNLRPSAYLFRSARSDRLSENNLLCYNKRFNEVGCEFGKIINVTSLKKNGVFYKVMIEDDKKSVSQRIQTLLGCDKAFAFGYKEIYQRWVEKYYGSDA